MNKLTEDINSALQRMATEDHTVQNGIRDALFDAVGPIFDTEATFFPLRPSSCLKPMRDLYYDLVNYYKPGTIPKAPFENRIKLIFQFGHLTETLLKKIYAYKFGVKFEQQRVKYGELVDKDGSIIPLTGAIDWTTDLNGTASSLILCDAKSIGDFPFKKAPKEDNIAQMSLYMHSDFGRANKLDRAQLIYFNKNTSDIKVIEVDYNPVLADNLLKRLQLVFEYYKKDEIPPREYVPGEWQNSYSAYKEYDNKEFLLPVEQRNTKTVFTTFPGPKPHTLEYGSQIINYLDRKCYATIEKDKLVIKDLNENT